MVRISVQKRDEEEAEENTTTITFVRRSSTPLIKTICMNCGDRANLVKSRSMDDDPDRDLHGSWLSSQSFFKWERKLALPIRYQVSHFWANDHQQQHSLYTPIEVVVKQQQRQWWNYQPGKTQKAEKIICAAELFLDPAVMGIKRATAAAAATGQVSSSHYPAMWLNSKSTMSQGEGHNGVEFIKNFHLIFLRHRQCSFIEAHLKDKAQDEQQRRRQQLPLYGGY